MTKMGKRYQEAAKAVNKSQVYPAPDALKLAKQISNVHFDETVELHLKMGVDPRHSDQQVRGTALLPHGLGKKVRVLVFAQGEGEKAAQTAGADYTGGEELIKQIEDGFLDFDVALATPDLMSKVGKLGKFLGRKGLMPNPKSGTIVQGADLPRAIKEAKQGRVEFKLDKTALLHIPLGKVSFEEEKLAENLGAAVDAIMKAKPSGAKGQFIKSAHLSTTMGPGIKLDLKSLLSLAPA